MQSDRYLLVSIAHENPNFINHIFVVPSNRLTTEIDNKTKEVKNFIFFPPPPYTDQYLIDNLSINKTEPDKKKWLKLSYDIKNRGCKYIFLEFLSNPHNFLVQLRKIFAADTYHEAVMLKKQILGPSAFNVRTNFERKELLFDLSMFQPPDRGDNQFHQQPPVDQNYTQLLAGGQYQRQDLGGQNPGLDCTSASVHQMQASSGYQNPNTPHPAHCYDGYEMYNSPVTATPISSDQMFGNSYPPNDRSGSGIYWLFFQCLMQQKILIM